MRKKILAIAIFILPALMCYGQTLWFKKSPVTTNQDSVKLIVFVQNNSTLIQKNIEKFWTKNIELKSISDWKYFKHKKNRNQDELYLLIESVNDIYETNKTRARPKKTFNHKGISFKLFCRNKKHEFISFTTHDEHFDQLEIVSSVLVLRYLTNSLSKGISKRNIYSFFSTAPEKLVNKTLLITNHYTNLAGIEKSGFFPKEIKMVSHEKILKKIENNDADFAFPIITFTGLGKKEYYRTIIVDGETNQPLMMYSWTLDKK